MRERVLSFAERVGFFISTLHSARLEALLEGFVDSKRYTATQFCQRLASFDSATRQARVAIEFGVTPASAERLRQLVARSPPSLSAVLTDSANACEAVAFGSSAVRRQPEVGPNEPPALRAQARRLVHETVR